MFARTFGAIVLATLAACGDEAPVAAPLDDADRAVLARAEDLLYHQAPEQVPALLEPLLARDPTPVEAEYLAGQAAYYLQDWAACVTRLEQVLERDEADYLTRCNALGFAHAKRGDYADARTLFERIVAADPEESKAWYGLAHVALLEGRLPDARVALDRSLALRPDYLKARFAEVRLLDAEGRSDEALVAVTALLDAWPSNEEALFLQVKLLRAEGRDDEADQAESRRAAVYAAKEQIATLAGRIRAGDDDPAARRALVLAYLQLGDAGEARDALLGALAVFPDDPGLRELAQGFAPR
ncbi:MAG: tetratricopeptide repeat protein [Planctomycetes bacterium]|nr:tetratricopeptide repeat protein [Planctomycetota bacterium]